MADPASSASTFSALPAQLQTVLTWGLGAGGVIAGALAYFKVPKPKPDPDAKTVAVAMAAPLGDPNQLRQVVEALNRLGDLADHGLKTMDEIKTGQERALSGAARAEDALNRVERAVRDVDDTLTRSPRR